MEESSHALFEAIGGRVYIKSVSIVVPSTWRDGKCQRVINSPRVDTPYRNADIVVGGTHPVHGDSPYTQQSKGCGVKYTVTIVVRDYVMLTLF